MIQSWIISGELIDNYQEFFIYKSIYNYILLIYN